MWLKFFIPTACCKLGSALKCSKSGATAKSLQITHPTPPLNHTHTSHHSTPPPNHSHPSSTTSPHHPTTHTHLNHHGKPQPTKHPRHQYSHVGKTEGIVRPELPDGGGRAAREIMAQCVAGSDRRQRAEVQRILERVATHFKEHAPIGSSEDRPFRSIQQR